MLVAKDFRSKARDALSGKWWSAVGTGFLASILGIGTVFMGASSLNSIGSLLYLLMLADISEDALLLLAVMIVIFYIFAFILSIVVFIIGGPITLGYVKFNLSLTDGREAKCKDLFSQFHRFGEGFLVVFLRNLFIVLWMLLFILPAYILAIIVAVASVASAASDVMLTIILMIVLYAAMVPAVIVGTIKEYSYAMAPYILYENPQMSAYQAIQASKKLMKGNKWRLFCLGISFIGWSFLSLLTLGIGSLWLRPYQEAAFAAFYKEIKRERYGEPVPVPKPIENPYEQDSIYNNI